MSQSSCPQREIGSSRLSNEFSTLSLGGIISLNPEEDMLSARKDLIKFFSEGRGRAVKFCRQMNVDPSNMVKFLKRGTTWPSCTQAVKEFYTYTTRTQYGIFSDEALPIENPLTRLIKVEGRKGRILERYDYTEYTEDLLNNLREMGIVLADRIEDPTIRRPYTVLILFMSTETSGSEQDKLHNDFEKHIQTGHVRIVDKEFLCAPPRGA